MESEHSLNGEDWDGLLEITADDIEGRTASAFERNVAVELIRGNVTELADASGEDLTVDGYVHATGNPGTGYESREV